MKTRTKNFLDVQIADKDLNQDEAYLMTHKTTNRATARVNASKLMAKPEAQLYLKKHEDEAAATIVDVMRNSRQLKDEPAHAKIASDNAEKILDRRIGKPLTRTNNLNMNINIEAALENLI